MAWDRLIKHEGVFTLGETNIYLWMRKTKVFGTLLWLASAWIGMREGSDSEDRTTAGNQAAWVLIPDLPCSSRNTPASQVDGRLQRPCMLEQDRVWSLTLGTLQKADYKERWHRARSLW